MGTPRGAPANQSKKCKNFTVVPLCLFERKFVKYDTREVHGLVRELNLLPRKKTVYATGKQLSLQQNSIQTKKRIGASSLT